eukprot:860444-Prymnesium_polylepis.1
MAHVGTSRHHRDHAAQPEAVPHVERKPRSRQLLRQRDVLHARVLWRERLRGHAAEWPDALLCAGSRAPGLEEAAQ